MDVTSWLDWFLTCLNRSFVATEETLSAVLTRAKFWETHSNTKFNERQKLMLTKLLDRFEGKLTTSTWAKFTKSSHDTALRDIKELTDLGVLVKDNAGGRSTSYNINPSN